MQKTLHYNLDQAICIKSFGFQDSWYKYVPRKIVTSWFWFVKDEIEEHIEGIFRWCPYPVELFFEYYPYYVFWKNDEILRKPRILITFSDSDSVDFYYESEEEMQKAFDSIIEAIPNKLQCNNF